MTASWQIGVGCMTNLNVCTMKLDSSLSLMWHFVHRILNFFSSSPDDFAASNDVVTHEDQLHDLAIERETVPMHQSA